MKKRILNFKMCAKIQTQKPQKKTFLDGTYAFARMQAGTMTARNIIHFMTSYDGLRSITEK